jgi:hypothetical protein
VGGFLYGNANPQGTKTVTPARIMTIAARLQIERLVMGNQCQGCPWLDEQKTQCRRTPPRFCTLDTPESDGSSKELLGATRREGQHEVQAK